MATTADFPIDDARLEQAIVQALDAAPDPSDPYDTPGHRFERAIRRILAEEQARSLSGGPL